MTTEQIIKVVAELDGRKACYTFGGYSKAPCLVCGQSLDEHKPDDEYLTSRDAIVPIREKLVNTQALKDEWMELAVMVILESENEVDEYALTHLTAAQECQTLLLLFKKWN